MNHISLRTVLLLVLGTFYSLLLKAQKYDFVVAADGSGDFKTVQEAIRAVPEFRKSTTTIYIKNGVYKEKLTLAGSKTMVRLIGESVEKTILTYDDYHEKKNRFGENMGTSGSAGFFIFGDDFSAENITFQNSAGPVGQAVAVWISGDKAQFRNCRFLGFQDTLYTFGRGSRQYYENCYIEGTVDFIFGSSTAIFNHCDIYCKSEGYITAASTPDTSRFGYVFYNCRITGSAGKSTVYLGRPWRPYARVVYINCDLGEMIKPEGWNNWGKESNEKTAYFAEYQNKGKGFAREGRHKWSFQLNDSQVREYKVENIMRGWMPEFCSRNIDPVPASK